MGSASEKHSYSIYRPNSRKKKNEDGQYPDLGYNDLKK